MAKIYVSSTFTDLKDCRSRVYHALRRLEHDVKAMEDYVARDDRPLDACVQDVLACEIYVGIFAWRYGYIPADAAANPQRRSITELEYRAAREANKPCLLFVLDESAPWIAGMMDSQTGEADGGARIRALRKELLEAHIASQFRSCDELSELVSIAVTNHLGGGGHIPPVTAAQKFRQVSDQVLIACSEIDRPIADAWAGELSRRGLRVRVSPLALLSERPADFVQLEREATQSHSALVVLSGASIDQLRTRPDAARRVFSIIESRTRCSIALLTVSGEVPDEWPVTQTAHLSGQGPATQPTSEAVNAVAQQLETLCPTLRTRETVIGLPFVVIAMTREEAEQLEARPDLLQAHLPAPSLERFNELKASLAAATPGTSWTMRYGRTRLDWRPLGGSLPMTAILDDVLERLNGATAGAAARRMKLQYYPIDPWISPAPQAGSPGGDPILRPLYQSVAQSGCVALVDELSLFHPGLGLGAQTFLNQAPVSVATVAPSCPAHTAIEELLETETRRQLALAYSRFETEFDPRIELRVGEERRLRRWLHSSLPETLRQLREPPPNRGRLAEFRGEVGAERQGIGAAIFRDPGRE